MSCNSGHVEDSGICVLNECSGSVPEDAKENETEQRYGVEWTYSETPGTCTFKCEDNYEWNGSECEATIVGNDEEGRRWTDGRYGRSCNEYKNEKLSGYEYAGSIGDGVYWIDPDGSGGESEFKAYCDMTNDGGGWTLVNKIYLDDTNPGKYVDVLDQSWINNDMNINYILNKNVNTNGTKPAAGHELNKFNALIDSEYNLRYEFISSDGIATRKAFVFTSTPDVFLKWQVDTPSFVLCSDLNKTHCNNDAKWINGGNNGDSTELYGSSVLDSRFVDPYIHIRYNGTYQGLCSGTYDDSWWPDNGADGHWGNGQRTWLR